jgi:hypothetical protein
MRVREAVEATMAAGDEEGNLRGSGYLTVRRIATYLYSLEVVLLENNGVFIDLWLKCHIRQSR